MKDKICPYPGLRPFTQEESIFFKGRDLHIRQVINQLEERKFVMVTGASGDGKSSLIYAGVIPNAAAGFFRSEYNNWLFLDFRPERDPIKNLAITISEKLEIPIEDVSHKLQYGFSAIINLYKSTKFYIDKEAPKWTEADSYEKKRMKNEAANIFILADQFEEFFTNQENYINGKTSTSAYTTVNLLLETARIAISEKLPIYVVFTMRSDFISQCVAFKGLPEFIGFSQFFIPRLKRNELQQVIEEPALLSGGKIAPRLVEVLINEIRDGFDQLPVLQHCLNSLWKLAENGNQEIDLIHLSKLGGMDPKYLNVQDKENFDLWFLRIDDYKKTFFKNYSLANVLNSHANDLYMSAYKYFIDNIEWAKKDITEDEAKFIIKTSFQCLTKIDEGRAVRNRMTLAEISRIINRPNITTDVVCGIMNIFRLPTSTFVRPFIDPNDIATQYLSTDSVWDITHESLIRNWDLLIEWGEEEYKILANFKDFTTQLNRWLDNGRNDTFLLSIGNLLHFEEWYKKSNLNSFWIAKYDNSEIEYEERLKNSRTKAIEAKHFLKQSRENYEKNERAKKRQRIVAAISAIVAIIGLSFLTFWALSEKSEAEQQKTIAMEETRKAEDAKLLADKNALDAYNAKLQSDSARTLAEQLKTIADEKTYLAIIESQNALREKNRAEQQRLIAEEQRKNADQQRQNAETERQNAEIQRNIAEVQKSIAEEATEKATRLSYLTIAQALTFKAMQNYNDKQINLLLAYHAYLINKENNGDIDNADIFQALLKSLEIAEQTPILFSTNLDVSNVFFGKERFKMFTNKGEMLMYEYLTKKQFINDDFTSKIPANQTFIFENKVLISYEDIDLWLWDSKSNESFRLKGHTDFVRAAVLADTKNLLITGGRDMTLKFWDISQKNDKILQDITLDDKITNIVLTKNQENIFVATYSGKIYKINTSTYQKTFVVDNYVAVTAMEISQDENILFIGTINGKIKIIYQNNPGKNQEIDVAQTKIQALAISPDSKFIAVATASKLINIYQIAKLEIKNYTISNFKQKIKFLKFENEEILYAFSENNALMKWNINNTTLSTEVYNLITRNLTTEEWEKLVGTQIEYKTLTLK